MYLWSYFVLFAFFSNQGKCLCLNNCQPLLIIRLFNTVTQGTPALLGFLSISVLNNLYLPNRIFKFEDHFCCAFQGLCFCCYLIFIQVLSQSFKFSNIIFETRGYERCFIQLKINTKARTICVCVSQQFSKFTCYKLQLNILKTGLTTTMYFIMINT